MASRRTAGFVSAFYNPLKVPDAPTIGTASSVNSTTASITFTAPSNIGGGSILSYVAVATKTSDGTKVSATGSSSPISITGLTQDSAYTITVAAVNSYGPSPFSSPSGSVTPVLVVGESYQGGYYAGLISTSGDGVATHRLIVAPISSGQSSLQWKITASDTTGTSSVIDGPSNTTAMIDGLHPAASFCDNLTIGSYSDWYMPAKNELEICYFNLKPTTTNNVTSDGINNNSVPKRTSNYTTTNPAQTSSTDFQSTGSEAFNNASNYWSSTQFSSTLAWDKSFNTGSESNITKTGSRNTRAVRRVAV